MVQSTSNDLRLSDKKDLNVMQTSIEIAEVVKSELKMGYVLVRHPFSDVLKEY